MYQYKITVPAYVPANDIEDALDRSFGGHHLDHTSWIHGNVTPSNIPSIIRTAINTSTPLAAANGVSSVSTEVANIPIPNTRLPPILAPKYPPMNCVVM